MNIEVNIPVKGERVPPCQPGVGQTRGVQMEGQTWVRCTGGPDGRTSRVGTDWSRGQIGDQVGDGNDGSGARLGCQGVGCSGSGARRGLGDEARWKQGQIGAGCGARQEWGPNGGQGQSQM